VLFVGSTYAGHASRLSTLRDEIATDDRLRATFRSIRGWNERGMMERLPAVPRGLKGRLRPLVDARALAAWPRPDAIWTSGREELAPWLAMQPPWSTRPLVYDLDATDGQLEGMAPWYFGRAPKTGWRRTLAHVQERAIWNRVTLFTPWSRWVANELEREGIDAGRIRVLPPGVDIERWPAVRRGRSGGPLRLLFVGGDFCRKGGPLLLEAFAQAEGSFELAIVTREAIGEAAPGVRVVRAEAGDAAVRDLHEWADLFILPTLADCFGIATIEAMASALPVVVSDVGSTAETVVDGVSGRLIRPSVQDIVAALEWAAANRSSLPALGARGRAIAVERFDARRNVRRLVEWLLELASSPNRSLPPLAASGDPCL
jgi:glycosyltransferase involved in cell wall biosynthesis